LSKKIFQHPEGEIWEVATCHSNEKLLSTKHSKVRPQKHHKKLCFFSIQVYFEQVDSNAIGVLKIGGTVWRTPENSLEPLELVCHVKNGKVEIALELNRELFVNVIEF